jgi:serine/threonine protein kinase
MPFKDLCALEHLVTGELSVAWKARAQENAGGGALFLKQYSLGTLRPDQRGRVAREMFLFLELSHPNIVVTKEWFHHGEHTFLVQELAPHGDLHTLLAASPEGRLPESRTRRLVAPVLRCARTPTLPSPTR